MVNTYSLQAIIEQPKNYITGKSKQNIKSETSSVLPLALKQWANTLPMLHTHVQALVMKWFDLGATRAL